MRALRSVGVAWVVGALACVPAPPPRSTFARYPGAPAEREAGQSDPRALAIADRVFAAAGGAHWDAAHELRWTQITFGEQVESNPTPIPRPGPREYRYTVDSAAALTQQHIWDRWNARYIVRWTADQHANGFRFDIYGSDTKLTTRNVDPRLAPDKGGEPIPMRIFAEGNGGLRARWHANTALLWLPFLLHEPGAKLSYLEPVYDDDGEAEQIRLNFPADPRRSAATLELTISKADIIKRVSIETAPDVGNTYDLSDWITVAGLTVPTQRVDLATGAITRISDIAVSPDVDNNEFEFP